MLVLKFGGGLNPCGADKMCQQNIANWNFFFHLSKLYYNEQNSEKSADKQQKLANIWLREGLASELGYILESPQAP